MSFLSAVFGCGGESPVPSNEEIRRPIPLKAVNPHNKVNDAHSKPPILTSPPHPPAALNSVYPHSRKPSLKPSGKPYAVQKHALPESLGHHKMRSGGMHHHASYPSNVFPFQAADLAVPYPERPQYFAGGPFQHSGIPAMNTTNGIYGYPFQTQSAVPYQPVFVHPALSYGYCGGMIPPAPPDWVVYPSQFPSAQQRSSARNSFSETTSHHSPSQYYMNNAN